MVKKLTPQEVKNLSKEEKYRRIEELSSALVSSFSPSQIKAASIKNKYPQAYKNSAVVRAVDSPIKLMGTRFGTREIAQENLNKLDR